MNGHESTKVQHSLDGVDYPCGRRRLIEQAKSNGADTETIQLLEGLPLHVSFGGLNAVYMAISHIKREDRRRAEHGED